MVVVVVVKWSECTLSTLAIPVRIAVKFTALYSANCLIEKNKNKGCRGRGKCIYKIDNHQTSLPGLRGGCQSLGRRFESRFWEESEKGIEKMSKYLILGPRVINRLHFKRFESSLCNLLRTFFVVQTNIKVFAPFIWIGDMRKGLVS